MGDWSARGGQGNRREASHTAATVFGAPEMTSSVTANTKGAYKEFIASTAFDAQGFWVDIATVSTLADFLVDVAVGAEGSEQVILSNWLFSVGDVFFVNPHAFFVPLDIPKDTRISGRMQTSAGGSDTARVIITMVSRAFHGEGPLGVATTYGAATGDSGGASVDPGGTANIKGAYKELSASSNRVKQLLIFFGTRANADPQDAGWMFDIAVGIGGSEQVIVQNLHQTLNVNVDALFSKVLGPFDVDIPAETRIAVASSSSLIDATDRLLDVVLIGFE